MAPRGPGADRNRVATSKRPRRSQSAHWTPSRRTLLGLPGRRWHSARVRSRANSPGRREPPAHQQQGFRVARSRLLHDDLICPTLIPDVQRGACRRTDGLSPAMAPLHGEGLGSRTDQAVPSAQRARIAQVGVADPALAISLELRAARPCTARRPCRKGRQPGQARDGDVGRTHVPRCAALQDEMDEPASVGREVAALRIDPRAKP